MQRSWHQPAMRQPSAVAGGQMHDLSIYIWFIQATEDWRMAAGSKLSRPDRQSKNASRHVDVACSIFKASNQIAIHLFLLALMHILSGGGKLNRHRSCMPSCRSVAGHTAAATGHGTVHQRLLRQDASSQSLCVRIDWLPRRGDMLTAPRDIHGGGIGTRVSAASWILIPRFF
jgi:hypothetical protein